MSVARRKTNEQTNLEAKKKKCRRKTITNDRSISANGGKIEIENINGTADVLVHSIFRFFLLCCCCSSSHKTEQRTQSMSFASFGSLKLLWKHPISEWTECVALFSSSYFCCTYRTSRHIKHVTRTTDPKTGRYERIDNLALALNSIEYFIPHFQIDWLLPCGALY